MYIAAAGAKFGQRDKGFTVRSRGAGIAISASNVVSRAMTGVHVLSPGATISGNVLESNLPAIWVPGGVDTVIDGNHIVNSFFEGIKITSDSVTISHNVVAGNGGEGVAVGDVLGTVVASNRDRAPIPRTWPAAMSTPYRSSPARWSSRT